MSKCAVNGVMSRLGTVLLGFYLSVLFFTILSYFYGEKGFTRYTELERYRDRLAHNVEELEQYHLELKTSAQLLTDSRDAVALAARQLGYFQEGEKRILLTGGKAGFSGSEPYRLASFIKPFKSRRERSDLLRILSVIPLLIAVIIAITEKRGGNR